MTTAQPEQTDVVDDYDEPADIARSVARCPRPLLLGLDVDGVLAPIVAHADDATLLAGMADAIGEVAAVDGLRVAVVSGRSLAGLAQFGFGDEVDMIGSHGMETRDRPMTPLDAGERSRLDRLEAAATAAATRAGDGAWVEHKPASVVLHVREADADAATSALADLAEAIDAVEGATGKAGSGVLEAFARHADKGSALVALAEQLGTVTTVFVGDDITDEEAFARLGPTDVTIKVGDADTIAQHRLRDPDSVLAFLRTLATAPRA
jgi:trehalose-phosphatase